MSTIKYISADILRTELNNMSDLDFIELESITCRKEHIQVKSVLDEFYKRFDDIKLSDTPGSNLNSYYWDPSYRNGPASKPALDCYVGDGNKIFSYSLENVTESPSKVYPHVVTNEDMKLVDSHGNVVQIIPNTYITIDFSSVFKFMARSRKNRSSREKTKKILTEVDRFKWLYVHNRMNELGIPDERITFSGTTAKDFSIRILCPLESSGRRLATNEIVLVLANSKASKYTVDENTMFNIRFESRKNNTYKRNITEFNNMMWKNLESLITCFSNSYDFTSSVQKMETVV